MLTTASTTPSERQPSSHPPFRDGPSSDGGGRRRPNGRRSSVVRAKKKEKKTKPNAFLPPPNCAFLPPPKPGGDRDDDVAAAAMYCQEIIPSVVVAAATDPELSVPKPENDSTVAAAVAAPAVSVSVSAPWHCQEIPQTTPEPRTTDLEVSLPKPRRRDHHPSIDDDAEGGSGGTTSSSSAPPPPSSSSAGGTTIDDGDGSIVVVRSRLRVAGICCPAEVPSVRSIVLASSPGGVTDVTVNVPAKIAYVDHDPTAISASDVARALNDERFGARVISDGGAGLAEPSSSASPAAAAAVVPPASSSSEDVDGRVVVVVSAEGGGAGPTERTADDDDEMEESSVGAAVVLSGLFWILSMLSLGCERGHRHDLRYAGLVSVAFGIPPVALRAVRSLFLRRPRRFDSNCMMFFACCGALALGEYPEAASVAFLFSVSERLEDRATTRARRALSDVANLRPTIARIVDPVTGRASSRPASDVTVGTMISIRSGDRIPCDGTVIDGTTNVDESSLTGESRPARKGPGDDVRGGTVNVGSRHVVVRATSTAANSTASRLADLVEEAQSNASPTEKFVDKFAGYYTPAVACLATSMCTVPWAFGTDVGRQWTMNGLVTIVVACPCALVISTPVAYVAGLAATARGGILVKGGAHLEALGLAKKIAFDKTGTLTEGNFAVVHLRTVPFRRTRKEVLEYLALLESRASHPLASALLSAAREEGATVPNRRSVRDHRVLEGEGVAATVDGVAVHVGNARLFGRLGMLGSLPDDDRSRARHWEASGGTVGFLGIENEGIVGLYCVADAVRPNAKSVVGRLRQLGIEPFVLSGDSTDAARIVGQSMGFDETEILGDLLPEDKLKIVAGMKEEDDGGGGGSSALLPGLCGGGNDRRRRGRVLMCGDGVNDAPALAIADVGIAMGANGAALALETSDVTLMDSDLEKLLRCVEMGRKVVRTVRQNVAFSLATKAIVMCSTLAGRTTLWAAIATDVGSMLVVTFNGMRLLPSDDDGDGGGRCEGLTSTSFDLEDGNCTGKGDVEEGGRGARRRIENPSSWYHVVTSWFASPRSTQEESMSIPLMEG